MISVTKNISARLKEISEYISPDDRVADIGSDHGYLLLLLLDKGCKRLFCQMYIPSVEEDEYNNFIPRIKLSNSELWSSSNFVVAQKSITTKLNDIILHAELFLDENRAFFVAGGNRAQYQGETFTNANAVSLGKVFTFDESDKSGVYFELYNRVNYAFPAETEICIVGMN